MFWKIARLITSPSYETRIVPSTSTISGHLEYLRNGNKTDPKAMRLSNRNTSDYDQSVSHRNYHRWQILSSSPYLIFCQPSIFLPYFIFGCLLTEREISTLLANTRPATVHCTECLSSSFNKALDDSIKLDVFRIIIAPTWRNPSRATCNRF